MRMSTGLTQMSAVSSTSSLTISLAFSLAQMMTTPVTAATECQSIATGPKEAVRRLKEHDNYLVPIFFPSLQIIINKDTHKWITQIRWQLQPTLRSKSTVSQLQESFNSQEERASWWQLKNRLSPWSFSKSWNSPLEMNIITWAGHQHLWQKIRTIAPKAERIATSKWRSDSCRQERSMKTLTNEPQPQYQPYENLVNLFCYKWVNSL